MRFRKLAASLSTRPGEIREISCVIRESREEAGEERRGEERRPRKILSFSSLMIIPLQFTV